MSCSNARGHRPVARGRGSPSPHPELRSSPNPEDRALRRPAARNADGQRRRLGCALERTNDLDRVVRLRPARDRRLVDGEHPALDHQRRLRQEVGVGHRHVRRARGRAGTANQDEDGEDETSSGRTSTAPGTQGPGHGKPPTDRFQITGTRTHNLRIEKRLPSQEICANGAMSMGIADSVPAWSRPGSGAVKNCKQVASVRGSPVRDGLPETLGGRQKVATGLQDRVNDPGSARRIRKTCEIGAPFVVLAGCDAGKSDLCNPVGHRGLPRRRRGGRSLR